MNRPHQPAKYDDRFLDCQQSMEEHFNDIMEAAINSGWSPVEAAAAITDLADNYMLKLFAIEETEMQIAAAVANASGANPSQ